MKKIIFLVLIVALIAMTCEKETPNIHIEVSFENTFANEALIFHKRYKTLEGTELELTKLQYYISNIELERADGTTWKETNSYHIIRAYQEGSNHIDNFTLKDVPIGDYQKIRFSLGVDSLANYHGTQKGTLNPSYGMFWIWKTGYIFFKMEGFYVKNNKREAGLIYHIGGDEAYKTYEFEISNHHKIAIVAELQKLFGGFEGASITLDNTEDKNDIMGGPLVTKVAKNYEHIFRIK